MGMRPKLRPKDEEFDKIKAAVNSGGGDDKPASGGKGGGKSVNPMAKKGSADYKTMQKANAPDSFYGYYDQNTGDYVPWYIDMINGGGANQAGPQFEGGFGTARLAGGLLNAAGVSPYGQDRPRAFMPFEAYRGGDTEPAPFDYRSGSVATPAPTGRGAGDGVIDAVMLKPDQRNMDIVDAYNRSQADAGAQAALMSDIYDGTILAPGAGGLRNRQSGQPQFPAQSYANMPMGELGRGTPMPTTGTADMPPELLPMFTIEDAYDDLLNRGGAFGGIRHKSGLMPGYSAEKRLIEISEFPREVDLSEIDYRSLMPPELLPQPQVNASVYEGVPEAARLGLLGQQTASSEQLTEGLPLQSNVYTRKGYAQRPSYVQTPRGMDLPPDVAMSRAMEALRQRFPNATPEQLANAAAMMGM